MSYYFEIIIHIKSRNLPNIIIFYFIIQFYLTIYADITKYINFLIKESRKWILTKGTVIPLATLQKPKNLTIIASDTLLTV